MSRIPVWVIAAVVVFFGGGGVRCAGEGRGWALTTILSLFAFWLILPPRQCYSLSFSTLKVEFSLSSITTTSSLIVLKFCFYILPLNIAAQFYPLSCMFRHGQGLFPPYSTLLNIYYFQIFFHQFHANSQYNYKVFQILFDLKNGGNFAKTYNQILKLILYMLVAVLGTSYPLLSIIYKSIHYPNQRKFYLSWNKH